MSDLHLEFEYRREYVGDAEWYALRDLRRAAPGHPDIGPYLGDAKGNIDIMVLAGDIWTGTKGIGYAAAVRDYLQVPVVYLCGNHEFYGQIMPDLRRGIAAEAAAAGITFLDNTRADFTIGDRTLAVLGTTLWTDYNLDKTQALALSVAANRINDHSSIYTASNLEFSPKDALALHQESRAWLEREIPIAKGEADRVLVVTHHGPTKMAIPSDRSRAGSAWAYTSDVDEMIAELQPDGWIFGHVHDQRELEVAGVPVVCNCRGYVSRGVGWDFRPAVLKLG